MEAKWNFEIEISVKENTKIISLFESADGVNKKCVFVEQTDIRSGGAFQTKSGIAGAVNLLENLLLGQKTHCYYINDKVMLTEHFIAEMKKRSVILNIDSICGDIRIDIAAGELQNLSDKEIQSLLVNLQLRLTSELQSCSMQFLQEIESSLGEKISEILQSHQSDNCKKEELPAQDNIQIQVNVRNLIQSVEINGKLLHFS
jgi:hypothetical protein